MHSLFYLYTFVYATHKIYRLFAGLFGKKKKEEPIEINFLNVNLPELLAKTVSLDMLLAICNFIWLLIGLFKHESLLFGIILFVDVISIVSALKKGSAERMPLIVINTLVKLTIAGFIIYTHFFN